MENRLDRKVAPHLHRLVGKPLPALDRCTLDNGVELAVLNYGQQSVNRITISWPVGTADVDAPEALKLMRAMLNEGTAGYSAAEIADILEFNGAWIKTEVGLHSTCVTLYSLNATAENVFPVLGEIIGSPLFESKSFESIREKEAAACELRRRKVRNMVMELSSVMQYGDGHPLAHITTPGQIRGVVREAILKLCNSLMHSLPPTIYIAGKVDSALLNLVKRIFGSLDFSSEGNSLSRRIISSPLHEQDEKRVTIDESSMQTAIKIVMPVITREHPDYEALRFTVFALGGYFGSRLVSNIREEKGYTYGITASLQSLHEGASVSISCETDNKYASAVLTEVEREIDILAKVRMNPAEFELVTNSIMSGLVTLLDSPFNMIDYYRVIDSFGMKPDYYTYQIDELTLFTPERLQYCAATYLAPAVRLFAMAGNPV